jgi:hypothetical protein
MGWLFKRKKKVPRVPFPEALNGDEGTLKFPDSAGDKIIEPEDVKDAAGLSEEIPEMEQEMPVAVPKKDMVEMPSLSSEMSARETSPIINREPLFVKVDVYQRILGEVGNLKEHLLKLGEANRDLENSEYNEEANFDKLRRSMKAMHDRLLKADKVLFK